jgi:hypothetical protein
MFSTSTGSTRKRERDEGLVGVLEGAGFRRTEKADASVGSCFLDFCEIIVNKLDAPVRDTNPVPALLHLLNHHHFNIYMVCRGWYHLRIHSKGFWGGGRL